jgi:hypothetical protein
MRVRWTEYMACKKMRNAYKIIVRKPEWKRPLGRLGIDGRIILNWILRKVGVRVWTGFI